MTQQLAGTAMFASRQPEAAAGSDTSASATEKATIDASFAVLGSPAATPTAHATHASAIAAPASAAPADPAKQVAPVLIQLAQGPSGSAVTLRLDPANLGHVQVRIEQNQAGAQTIQVSVERPETLRLLVADQQHLHQALDSAGLSGDGRSLTFSLATPSGNAFAENQSGGGQPGASRRPRPSGLTSELDSESGMIPQPTWLRAGVDITA